MPSRITPEQISIYDQLGYLRLEGFIPDALVDHLSTVSSSMLDHLTRLGPSASHLTHATWNGQQTSIIRVDHLLSHQGACLLQVLGNPDLFDSLSSLLGDFPIPIYESLVVKSSGDGCVVDWHRDFAHGREHRIVTLGIYLDDSHEKNAALKVLAGSQRSSQTVCGLSTAMRDGHQSPSFIPASPGDVVIHDVMVAHASAEMNSRLEDNRRRRTLYFEFRPLAHFADNPNYPARWVDARKTLMKSARRYWDRFRESDTPISEILPEDQAIIDEINALVVRVEPGEYCFSQFSHGSRTS